VVFLFGTGVALAMVVSAYGLVRSQRRLPTR